MANAFIIARNVTPRFSHDCKECVFLGRLDRFDIYVCPKDGELIARFGSADGAYGSMSRAEVQANPGVFCGTRYAFALALAMRREKHPKAFKTNAYETEKWKDRVEEDEEPNSGQLEREYEDRVLAQAEARIGTF